MRRLPWLLLAVSIAAVFAAVLIPAPSQAGWPFGKKKTHIPDSPLVRVSRSLDQLERDLNEDGTVVIKSPDIWGEARLTKHRQEFERQMAQQVDEFKLLMNASIRRSDQAYLSNALAIQAALTPDGVPGNGTDSQNNPYTFVNSMSTGVVAGPPATPGATPAAANSAETPIVRTEVFKLGTTTDARNFGFVQSGIGLEPTIQLDQMKRYLDHLHEIRRVNEGDDTADSPGYSLNLVRVPVSLLPGAETKQGHGAEITVTALPHISPELLPRVFRELVINDLLDSVTVTTRQIAKSIDRVAYNQEYGKDCKVHYVKRPEWEIWSDTERISVLLFGNTNPKDIPDSQKSRLPQSYLRELTLESEESQAQSNLSTPKVIDDRASHSIRKYVSDMMHAVNSSLSLSTRSVFRNARSPISPTQVPTVYGRNELIVVAYDFWKQNTNEFDYHIPDVRAFLREELEAGYDFLNTQDHLCWWDSVPEIQKAIRANDIACLTALRENLRMSSPTTTYVLWNVKENKYEYLREIPSSIASAAWWILVEAALLNEQLNLDIQRVSRDPDCHCLGGVEHAFYHPHTSDEAKQAFVDYVKCRWPIHVFALDPVVQQQNVGDQFSMRREMQLALALAFAGGNMNAQNMTRYARRLELDMETIALNRTEVAFGHGSDTFGWRFYPRVQTPPHESNSTTIVRDLLHGGPTKDQLRHTWEIEPGMRECVAIVLMPSFIEHMTFHTRGNYFKMKSPDSVKSTHAENAYWSEQVRTLEKDLECLYRDADNYRFGEIERVRNRVDQLAKRLPMQTVYARVPNENTLGGFEMFSSGVTDLAPEVLDYYGEPGVDTTKNTDVYLVGNNFSVHETRVLVGNRECDFDLISRQVMKVTIPAGVQVVEKHSLIDNSTAIATREHFRNCPELIVDVHIATPYGVSGHLAIPVINRQTAGEVKKVQWGQSQFSVMYRFKVGQIQDPAKSLDATAKVNNFTIDDANVFLQKPHELVVDVPVDFQYSAAPEKNKLNLVVSYNQNRILVSQNLAVTNSLSYDAAKKKLTLSGSDYVTFQGSLKTAVTNLLNSHHKNSNPPTSIPLYITGKLDSTNIQGTIEVLVHLENLDK